MPSYSKRIGTPILETEKLTESNDLTLRGFACDIIRPCKELPVQS